MPENLFPNSVRYIKNGKGGQWWKAARTDNQIHAGWSGIPRELLLANDLSKIENNVKSAYGSRPGATQDFNALRDLLDTPSKHIWITFQDGYMWWCTASDIAVVNPNGESVSKGHFWLNCSRPWSNKSIKGRLLSESELPGSVTRTAGFKGTVCTPKDWQAVLRLIRDEKDPDAIIAANARSEYQSATLKMIQRLSPKDFELLIDLILTRAGWVRTSTVGKTLEGVDIDAENLAVREVAFVQIKSSADQKIFDDYIERFQQRRERYAKMIFAVHSPIGELKESTDPAVQVWTGDHLAQLVVRLGLGEWVETRLA